MAGSDRQRIDKWLWFARLAKTRTGAQRLAVSGRVRVNGTKSESASRPVKIGDVLTIAFDSGVRVFRIAAEGVRRGRSVEARQLYEDLSPPMVPRADRAETAPAARQPGSGRPTKRDRRRLDGFLGLAGEDFSPGED
jgi:ribosome-associated heat shock protein Hsp15